MSLDKYEECLQHAFLSLCGAFIHLGLEYEGLDINNMSDEDRLMFLVGAFDSWRVNSNHFLNKHRIREDFTSFLTHYEGVDYIEQHIHNKRKSLYDLFIESIIVCSNGNRNPTDRLLVEDDLEDKFENIYDNYKRGNNNNNSDSFSECIIS